MRRALPGGAPKTLWGRDRGAGVWGCGWGGGRIQQGCEMRWTAATGGSASFGSPGCLMALWNTLSPMPPFVLLPAFRPLPPPAPWSATEADW